MTPPNRQQSQEVCRGTSKMKLNYVPIITLAISEVSCTPLPFFLVVQKYEANLSFEAPILAHFGVE